MLPTHHVLPRHFVNHPVIQFLAGRFNHDAIGNLMALPSSQGLATDLSSSPHTGGHLGTYYEGFCEYLKKVQTSSRYDAALMGDARALDEMVSDLNGLVAAAKYALANGHLFANTPKGMTPEQANEENKKWFMNWRNYSVDYQTQIQQMQETVDQFNNAGQRDAALHLPLLSRTSGLSMAERTDILKRLPGGSPISLHFTPVGPVPDLPGLVPPFVDTRLPGFLPPSLAGLNQPEGFTPSNPSLTYGLPGFPVLHPDWQRLTEVPPSTAVPQDPLIFRFDPATGAPLPFSERSPILDPDPPSSDTPPAALYGAAALAALIVLAPEFAPLWAALGAAGLMGTAPARATGAEGGGLFSAGTTPYNAFNPNNRATQSSASSPPWPALEMQSKVHTLDREPEPASTFAGRFGSWIDTPAGTMPGQDAPGASAASAAEAAAPEEARRLTRVNASNAGSVFTSGSAPVPYLPSTGLNERFGNWTVPTADGRSPQTSKPIGVFADEPSHVIPPPIFGVDGPGSPRNDAEEWFSRWIRPLLPPE